MSLKQNIGSKSVILAYTIGDSGVLMWYVIKEKWDFPVAMIFHSSLLELFPKHAHNENTH